MKTAGQWTLMISGFVGTFLIGLTVFFLVFFPSCAPEYCARYSPSARQVITVFLAKKDYENVDTRAIARNRFSEHFRTHAIPVLEEILRSPQSSETDRWAAIELLADLEKDAQPTIPLIHATMQLHVASLERYGNDFLVEKLTRIGVTRDWQAGLTDPDPMISYVFWSAAGNERTVDGFLLCWDLLQAEVVVNRKRALESLEMDFDYPGLMKAPLDARIESRLDAVIAHGPEDMREAAKSLKAWNTPEASEP